KPTAQDPSNAPMPPAIVPEPTATPAPLSLAMANPATGQMPTSPGALAPNPNSQPPSPFDNGPAIAAPSEQAQPAPPPELEVVAPPPPPPPPPVFEPLQTFAPLSPVVGTLVLAANKSADKGNVESATATIERAIRIEPRNPTLFYKLALLRLRQSKPVLAEDLAKKSALLAAADKQLKKHSWLLIARAREMQNNLDGAKEARKKADNF
ncbi:MAG: hypothetical protein PHU14_13970, partial [Methylovulum sp.]|nr:hypothetical protein [Methylovulum sp.]